MDKRLDDWMKLVWIWAIGITQGMMLIWIILWLANYIWIDISKLVW